MEALCRMCRYAYDGEVRVPLTLPCGHRLCLQCCVELREQGALRCVQCEEASKAPIRPIPPPQRPSPVPQVRNPFILPPVSPVQPVPFPVQSLPNPELKAPFVPIAQPVARASEVNVTFFTPEGGSCTQSFKPEDYMWVLVPAAFDLIREKSRKFELISASGQTYSYTYLANTLLNTVVSASSAFSIRINYVCMSSSVQFTIKMPNGEANLIQNFSHTDSMVSVLETIARSLSRQNYPFSLLRENGQAEDEVRLFGLTVGQFETGGSVVLQVVYSK